VVSFADGEGGERPGVVNRLFDELVEVDFNHPLAGQDLLFTVQIKQVEQISDEIMRM
jgi:FKBP-type peptidyl-prolyl cis-trans isomerase SlpA